jgi:hypothetical protein
LTISVIASDASLAEVPGSLVSAPSLTALLHLPPGRAGHGLQRVHARLIVRRGLHSSDRDPADAERDALRRVGDLLAAL